MKKSRKGRRKLLGVLTAVCMAAVMIPAAAFADDVEDLEGGDGSTVYFHTYFTKVKVNANITVQDSDGNTVKTYQVKEESKDYIEGNVSDDAVQAEITRLEAAVNSQLPSGAVKSSRTTSTTFDHFVSYYILEAEKDQILIGGGTSSVLYVDEYQIHEITGNWTVKLGENVIGRVAVDNATLKFYAGDAPKFTGVPGSRNYGIVEFWYTLDEEGHFDEICYSDSEWNDYFITGSKKLLRSFEKGKKYYYGVIAEAPKEGPGFYDNPTLILNGTEYPNIMTPVEFGAGAFEVVSFTPTDKAASAGGDTTDKAAGKTDVKDKNVETGDHTNVGALAALMAVSAAGAALALRRRKA